MLKFFTGVTVSLLLTLPAGAKNSLDISLDLRNFRVLFYGTYSSENVAEAKTGLEAESLARTKGIYAMRDYITSNCNKSQGLNTSGSWRKGLTSLGSEVYPNAVLRVHMRSHLERIIQTDGATPFGPKEERSHVFCVRNRISLPEGSCGLLYINLDGKKYQFLPQKVAKGSAQPIALYPRGDTLYPLKKHAGDVKELLNSFKPNTGTVYLLPLSPTC